MLLLTPNAVAASMHALRLSSFMNRPTLLAVQILLLLGAYLVNTGKFLDAYSLYGLTIRVAQGMGCMYHRVYTGVDLQTDLRQSSTSGPTVSQPRAQPKGMRSPSQSVVADAFHRPVLLDDSGPSAGDIWSRELSALVAAGLLRTGR